MYVSIQRIEHNTACSLFLPHLLLSPAPLYFSPLPRSSFDRVETFGRPPPSERRSRPEARISVVTCERKQLRPWLNYGARGGVRNWERHWLHCV